MKDESWRELTPVASREKLASPTIETVQVPAAGDLTVMNCPSERTVEDTLAEVRSKVEPSGLVNNDVTPLPRTEILISLI